MSSICFEWSSHSCRTVNNCGQSFDSVFICPHHRRDISARKTGWSFDSRKICPCSSAYGVSFTYLFSFWNKYLTNNPLIFFLAVRIPTKVQGGLHYLQTSQPILQHRMRPRLPCSTSYKASSMASRKNQSTKRSKSYILWKNITTP